MVAVPWATPVTLPLLTVANAALLLVHTPPAMDGDKAIDEPIHTALPPDNVGTGLTVTAIGVLAETQLFDKFSA